MKRIAPLVLLACTAAACHHEGTSVDIIAACQCEKARTLAAKLDSKTGDQDSKALDYMGDVLACIEPHTAALKLLRADQLAKMQQKISEKVEKDCGEVMRKVKSN